MLRRKILDYYIPYLFGKKNLVQKHVVDQSDYFFSRAESIKNKDVKKFYVQLICSTMADGYDFFMDILKSKSYFSRIGLINDEKGKKIYKFNAIYYTIRFMDKDAVMAENFALIKNDMFKTFNFNKQDKKDFNKFLNLYKSNSSQFEVDFSRHVIRNTVGSKGSTPILLAFVANFFYSSYKSFANSYSTYYSFNFNEEFAS